MVEPFPPDAYYDLTLPSEVAVSPDGERVAFVATEFAPEADERRSSLFVVPADGSRDPHRVTRVADASDPAWSPDGRELALLAARERDAELVVGREGAEGDDAASGDADDDASGEGVADTSGEDDDADSDAGEAAGDEDGEPETQVWVFDLERGGDPRQVTDFEEGVRGFAWGPDGERLVAAARDPTDEERAYLDRREEGGPIETERLQHKYDGAGWLDAVTTYLFVVDLASRETRRLDDAYGGGAMEPAVGLQPAWRRGERIAFLSNRTERPDDSNALDVYTIAPDGSDLERVTDGDVTARSLAWSPSGERLAFGARQPDNWYVPMEAYVAADGDYWSVSGDLDRTLTWGGQPRWLDDDSLVALVGDEARTRMVRLHADGSPPERVLERQSPLETLAHLDVGGDAVAFHASRPGGVDVYAMGVGDLQARSTEDDPRTRLTALNDDLLGGYETPEVRRVRFESQDGTEIEGLVYHPPDFDPDEPDPRPTVLKIHGGPMSYDRPGFGVDELVYATRGSLVLEVNYRGSTSYGRAFCEVLRGAWNTVEVEDLQAGVDALVERGWADPDRLFCTGFSQGGVNTGYLLTRTDRFAAAAAEHGVYDLRSDFGTADAHNWSEADFGLPWENPEAYEASSSIPDVGEIDTPLLVTAGGDDWRCPPSQSEQLYVSVRKQGVPARLVVYPDEHHDVGEPDRAIHRLEELTGWFERFDPGRS